MKREPGEVDGGLRWLTVVDGGWPEFQRGMAERRERGGKRGMEMVGRKEAQIGQKWGGKRKGFERELAGMAANFHEWCWVGSVSW